MSGVDIFIAVLCAVMLFGGLFLNMKSVKLVDGYKRSHAVKPSNVSGAKAKAKVKKKV